MRKWALKKDRMQILSRKKRDFRRWTHTEHINNKNHTEQLKCGLNSHGIRSKNRHGVIPKKTELKSDFVIHGAPINSRDPIIAQYSSPVNKPGKYGTSMRGISLKAWMALTLFWINLTEGQAARLQPKCGLGRHWIGLINVLASLEEFLESVQDSWNDAKLCLQACRKLGRAQQLIFTVLQF